MFAAFQAHGDSPLSDAVERLLGLVEDLAVVAFFGGVGSALCLSWVSLSIWFGVVGILSCLMALYAAGHIIWSWMCHH
ncbi:hypothetical protein SAMN05444339_11526 [Loktanella atrilutea]|uniref:Uncharacterized protein n=1 Tax=Loktanella atrilutea TaxID=366533 RepID=A0A1M5EW20_LOKAT|nr:hypothetical protein SAMN05444339_11526 [Loktanella atrilutea]